ncbi:hypothetical protein [Roseibium sp.]|uniref:hypothetical protein n=1 Tax=Roseibium sp. TaxID=1936156 RepID=UPI003B5016E0
MKSFNEKLAGYGQWTYRAAWILEIIAATLGLSTGIALSYSAYIESINSNISITSVDLILAAAPFFLVALAELTKIPVATLMFAASWIWKPILLLFLGALAFITFETVFLGLERASSQRGIQYTELQTQIELLKTEDAEIVQSTKIQTREDEIGKILQQIEQLNRAEAADIQPLKDQLALIDERTKFEGANNPELVRVATRVQELEARRAGLLEERDAALDRDGGAFERQRESFERRIIEAQNNGELQKNVRNWTRQLDRLKNPRPEINAKYNSQIAEIDDQLEALRNERNEIAKRLTSEGNEVAEQLSQERANIEMQISNRLENWGGQKQAAQRRLQASYDNTEQTLETTIANQNRRVEIAGEIADLEQQRIRTAQLDQVRRLAGHIYGARPEDVKEDQAGLVGIVWFGSLAMLAALAGPITAIVALGLQRTAEKRSKHQPRGFSQLLRKMLLTWRFRRVKKVPVEVEVPVEKEVEKIVEVPVEKVVKEILYVPVLTDNPEELKRAISDNLEAEVAELVKVNLASKTDGSSTQHQPA